MKIRDRIYGPFTVEEPVLIELMNSGAMQRLKGIAQNGLPGYLHTTGKDFSRFEHSVGVMLLLRKLGAGLEEQVAGLIHDVSHTAFSHLSDIVFGNWEKEDSQDNQHEQVVLYSDIPWVLSRNGIDTGSVIDIRKFGLLERESPALCADRVDYALRDFMFDFDAITPCLNDLAVHDGQLVFTSEKAANLFGFGYMSCQKEHWSGPDPKVRWYLFSQALRVALDENIVSKEDFYETDNYVLEKMNASNNAEISGLLEKLSGKIKFKIDEENPQVCLKNKWRFVDPAYVENGIIYKLSEVNAEYRLLLKDMKAKHEQGLKVVIL
ncbi:MAG: HD domain-containing protein [DPANN group archaeon]|nr:HD domain-containing protein [DPANN group archaeon]